MLVKAGKRIHEVDWVCLTMAKEKGPDSDANEAVDEQSKAKDREGKELQEIRQRRMGGGRRFLSNIEDFVLMGGMAYGVLFALLLFSMSAGIMGNSTSVDHTASTTFLDIGDECTEITDEPWLNIFPDPDQELFSIAGHNLPNGEAYLNYTYFEIINEQTNSLVKEDFGTTKRFARSTKRTAATEEPTSKPPTPNFPKDISNLNSKSRSTKSGTRVRPSFSEAPITSLSNTRCQRKPLLSSPLSKTTNTLKFE